MKPTPIAVAGMVSPPPPPSGGLSTVDYGASSAGGSSSSSSSGAAAPEPSFPPPHRRHPAPSPPPAHPHVTHASAATAAAAASGTSGKSSSSNSGSGGGGWLSSMLGSLPMPTSRRGSANQGRNSRSGSRRPSKDVGVGSGSLGVGMTGDAALDEYKQSLDAMTDEVADVRARLGEFARTICAMADQATQVALVARHVCAEAQSWPASIGGFADAHENWCSQAMTLFEDEFAAEVLEPLDMWQEEAGQFLRELARTNTARLAQMAYKTQVDELFLQLADAAEHGELAVSSSFSGSGAGGNATRSGQGDAEDLEAELEFRLKIAKTDLGQACTNYSERCVGLRRHFDEITHGRIQALDVAFTRFMTQQHFFFRPGLRIVDAQLYADSSVTTQGLASPAVGLMSPRGRQRFGSMAQDLGFGAPPSLALASPSSLLSRSRKSTGWSGAGTSTGAASALEDEIIRTSHRINRKSYHAQTHHYHSDRQLLGGTYGAASAAGVGTPGPGKSPDSARSPRGGSDAPDIHPSLRYKSRVALSEQSLPRKPQAKSRAGAPPDEAALLDACKQLQAEMSQRRSTEEANERLRLQVEQLTAQAGAASAAGSGSGSGADAKLQVEIEELRRKLAEREADASKDGGDKKKEEAPVVAPDAPAVPVPDAPMAPPMDAPPPPPPPPGPPGPPGAPSAFGFSRRVVSAREKEKEEARRWKLPLLPAVSPDLLNAPGTDPKQRVTLKKLHWAPCAPEDIMGGPDGDAAAEGQAGGAEENGNVWKDLFTKAQQQAPGGATGTSDPVDPDSEQAALEAQVAPLVPVNGASASAADAKGDGVPSAGVAGSDDTGFSWRWEVDPSAFASLFAQKATAAMKRKTKPAVVPNKYALGRKGMREAEAARLAAGGSPRNNNGDDEESEGEESSSSSGSPRNNEGASDDERSESGSAVSKSRRSKKTAPAAPLVRVELIDAKRSYNVSISLTHMRLSPSAIRDAVMHLDSSGPLGLDSLEILAEILPSLEEAALVRKWVGAGGNPAHLGEVETFFLAMSEKGLRERLRLLLSMESFTPLLARLEDLVDLVDRGLGAIQSCKAEIAIVLGVILRVGNLMCASQVTMVPAAQVQGRQAGANRAIQSGEEGSAASAAPAFPVAVQTVKQSYGFFLPATLSKLRSVKSLDNQQTLLHFIVAYVQDKVRPPIHERLVTEMAVLRECARVEQAFLLAEIKQLQQELNMCAALIAEDDRQLARMAAAATAAAEGSSPTATAAAAAAAVPIAPSPEQSASPPPAESPRSSNNPSASPLPSPVSGSGSATGVLADAPYVPLPARVREFHSYASARLQSLDAHVSAVKLLHARLQSYYLIPARDQLPWEGFFGLWWSFLSDWMEAAEEMAERAAQEAKRVRQLEAAKALKAKRDDAARVKALAAQAKQVHAANAVAQGHAQMQMQGQSAVGAHQADVSLSTAVPPAAGSGSGSASHPSLTQSLLHYITPSKAAASSGSGAGAAAPAVSSAHPRAHVAAGDFSSFSSDNFPPIPKNAAGAGEARN